MSKLKIDYSQKRFKKDFKKARRELKIEDLKKLFDVISLLENQKVLPTQYRDHSLTGNWKDYRECHIKPDLLLIYRVQDSELQLVRLGSHSELFKK